MSGSTSIEEVYRKVDLFFCTQTKNFSHPNKKLFAYESTTYTVFLNFLQKSPQKIVCMQNIFLIFAV
ncbi:hypothetical protein HMPREF1990_00457 [Porphyromonas gingivalis W4087]|nr:hypothetical protein HMPREF1990_00457 [Porphyromonas gingivalis W4087]